MKQLDQDKLCKRCAGCNRLLLEEFNGVYRCENFIEMERKRNETNKNRIVQ